MDQQHAQHTARLSRPPLTSPEAKFAAAISDRDVRVVLVNDLWSIRIPRVPMDMEPHKSLAGGAVSLARVMGRVDITVPDQGLRCIAERLLIRRPEKREAWVMFAIVFPLAGTDVAKSIQRLVRKGLKNGWGYRRGPSPSRGPLPPGVPR